MGNEATYVVLINSGLLWAVPYLRRLVAGLQPRRPGFKRRDVRFVVDKVALWEVFLRLSPLLHTRRQPHVALTSRTKGRSLGTLQKTVLFRKLGSKYFQLVTERYVSWTCHVSRVGPGLDARNWHLRQGMHSASSTRTSDFT